MPVDSLLVFLAFFAGKGLPLGTPPGPEDPVIARVAPEHCLYYMSWAGAADPDPRSKNQSEQLLAEPEVQQLMRSMEPWLRRSLGGEGASYAFVPGTESPQPKTPPAGEQAAIDLGVDLLRALLIRPTAIFVEDLKLADGKPVRSGANVVRFGMVASIGVVASLGTDAERLQTAAEKVAKEGKTIEQVRIGGRRWYRWTTRLGRAGSVTWTGGFEGSYFVAQAGENAPSAILARMKRKEPPAWLTTIAQQVPIQRRTVVTYINLKLLRESMFAQNPQPELRRVVEMLGLDKVASLVQAGGLEGEGFVCRTLLATEGEPGGLLRLVSDRPLRPEDLKPIPGDATFALAFRLDLAAAVETVGATIEKNNPEAPGDPPGPLDWMDRQLSMAALRSLGDTWCIYNSPGEGGWLTVVVPIRNPATFLLAYGKVLDTIRKQFDDGGPPNAASPQIRSFPFADRTVFWFYAGRLGGYFVPAWCVNGHELVLSLTPQNVKAYLARGDDYQSLAAAPQVAQQFSAASSSAMLGYLDTPRVFELLYPFAPIVAKALQEFDLDLDVSLFPSAPAIRRHLRPEMAVLRRTPAGIEQTTYECLPEAGIGAAVVAGLVLASGALDSEDTPVPLAAPATPSNTAPVPPTFGQPAPATPPASPTPQSIR
jgi:hypothetical protein